MSTAERLSPNPEEIGAHLQELTLQACLVARIAAGLVAEGIATGVASLLDGVRQREKELDLIDREIDQGVTSVITRVSEGRARELLACLKFMIGLERVGDLLLNCSNRAASVGSRIDLQDIRDLTLMASRLEKMLGDVHGALSQRAAAFERLGKRLLHQKLVGQHQHDEEHSRGYGPGHKGPDLLKELLHLGWAFAWNPSGGI